MKFVPMFVLLFVTLNVAAQSHSDATEAFEVAAQSQKPVLLIFSGSDWCAPCVEFDKNIVQQISFQSFATQSLVVLKADFPQRSKLPKALQEQNEKLASLYNPKGVFPLVLLLRSDKSIIATLPVKHLSPEDFVSEIKRILLPNP